MWRHLERFAQQPVHAHAHDQAALIRFDVNVRHALADGLGDNAVDQADRRRIVGGVEQVLGARDAARQCVDFFRTHGDRGGFAVGHVDFGQQPVECRRVDVRDIERAREIAAHLEQRLRIGTCTHRNRRAVCIPVAENDTEAPRERIGKRRRSERIELDHRLRFGSGAIGRTICWLVVGMTICGTGGGGSPAGTTIAPPGIGGAMPM